LVTAAVQLRDANDSGAKDRSCREAGGAREAVAPEAGCSWSARRGEWLARNGAYNSLVSIILPYVASAI
jgi:hypothetical protein